MKQMLKNGRVLSPANHIDEVCDILIEDGKICEIGKNLSAEGTEVLDVSGKVERLFLAVHPPPWRPETRSRTRRSAFS